MESAAEVGANMLYALPSVVARADLVISDSAESVLDGCMLYVAVTVIASHFMTLREWIHVSPSDGDDAKADGLTKYAKYCAPPLPLIGGFLDGGNLAKGTGTVAMLGQTTALDARAAILAVIYLLLQAVCTVDVGLVALQWLMAGSRELVASRVTFDVLRADLSSVMSARRKANQNQSSFSSHSLMRRVSVLLDRALVIMKSERSSDKEKDDVEAFCVKAYSAFVSTRGAKEWMRTPMPPAMSIYTTTTLTLVMVFAMAGDRQLESVRKHFGRGSSVDDAYQYLLGTTPGAKQPPLSDYINYFLHRKADTPDFGKLSYAKTVDIFHKFVPIPWMVPIPPAKSTAKTAKTAVSVEKTPLLHWWAKVDRNETWTQMRNRLWHHLQTGRAMDVIRLLCTMLLRALHATVISASNFRLACYTVEDMVAADPMPGAHGTQLTTCIDRDAVAVNTSLLIKDFSRPVSTSCSWHCSDGGLRTETDLRKLPACDLAQAALTWKISGVSGASGIFQVAYAAALAFAQMLWGLTKLPSVLLTIQKVAPVGTEEDIKQYTSYYGRALGAALIGCHHFQAGCTTTTVVPLECPLGCIPLTQYGGMAGAAMYCDQRVSDYLQGAASVDVKLQHLGITKPDAYRNCVMDKVSPWWLDLLRAIVRIVADGGLLLGCPVHVLSTSVLSIGSTVSFSDRWKRIVQESIGGTNTPADWSVSLKKGFDCSHQDSFIDAPDHMDLTRSPEFKRNWLLRCPIKWQYNVTMMNHIWGSSMYDTTLAADLSKMLSVADSSFYLDFFERLRQFSPFAANAVNKVTQKGTSVGVAIATGNIALARACTALFGDNVVDARVSSVIGVLGVGGLAYTLGPPILAGAMVYLVGMILPLGKLLLDVVCTVCVLNVQMAFSLVGMFFPSLAPLRAAMAAVDTLLFTVGGEGRLALAQWSTGMWLNVYRGGFHRHIAASLLVWPFSGISGSGVWGMVRSLTDIWSGINADDKDEFGTRARQSSARYLLLLSVWTALQMRLQPNLACTVSRWIDTITSGRPDRTPGYDAHAVSTKLKELFTSQKYSLKNPMALDRDLTRIMSKSKTKDLVANKEKYMSRGAGQCRILQRMDDNGRNCVDLMKVVVRQAKHQLCTLKGEVDDAMLIP